MYCVFYFIFVTMKNKNPKNMDHILQWLLLLLLLSRKENINSWLSYNFTNIRHPHTHTHTQMAQTSIKVVWPTIYLFIWIWVQTRIQNPSLRIIIFFFFWWIKMEINSEWNNKENIKWMRRKKLLTAWSMFLKSKKWFFKSLIIVTLVLMVFFEF